MANDTITRVIESFRNDPKFMQGSASSRTQGRRDAIADASPDIQALRGVLPEYVLERLARADQE